MSLSEQGTRRLIEALQSIDKSIEALQSIDKSLKRIVRNQEQFIKNFTEFTRKWDQHEWLNTSVDESSIDAGQMSIENPDGEE